MTARYFNSEHYANHRHHGKLLFGDVATVARAGCALGGQVQRYTCPRESL